MKNFKTDDVLIRRFKKEDIDNIYKNFNVSKEKISNLSNL